MADKWIPNERKPNFAGPVTMWRDENVKFGYDGACHKCSWTLAEAVRWTMFDLDEAWLRMYFAWHIRSPHRTANSTVQKGGSKPWRLEDMKQPSTIVKRP